MSTGTRGSTTTISEAWVAFRERHQQNSSGNGPKLGKDIPPSELQLEIARKEWTRQLKQLRCAPFSWPTTPDEINQVQKVLKWKATEMWSMVAGYCRISAHGSETRFDPGRTTYETWHIEMHKQEINSKSAAQTSQVAPEKKSLPKKQRSKPSVGNNGEPPITENSKLTLDHEKESPITILSPHLFRLQPFSFHKIWKSDKKSQALREFAITKWHSLAKEFYCMAIEYEDEMQGALRQIQSEDEAEKAVNRHDKYHRQLASTIYRDWEQAICGWSENGEDIKKKGGAGVEQVETSTSSESSDNGENEDVKGDDEAKTSKSTAKGASDRRPKKIKTGRSSQGEFREQSAKKSNTNEKATVKNMKDLLSNDSSQSAQSRVARQAEFSMESFEYKSDVEGDIEQLSRPGLRHAEPGAPRYRQQGPRRYPIVRDDRKPAIGLDGKHRSGYPNTQHANMDGYPAESKSAVSPMRGVRQNRPPPQTQKSSPPNLWIRPRFSLPTSVTSPSIGVDDGVLDADEEREREVPLYSPRHPYKPFQGRNIPRPRDPSVKNQEIPKRAAQVSGNSVNIDENNPYVNNMDVQRQYLEEAAEDEEIARTFDPVNLMSTPSSRISEKDRNPSHDQPNNLAEYRHRTTGRPGQRKANLHRMARPRSPPIRIPSNSNSTTHDPNINVQTYHSGPAKIRPFRDGPPPPKYEYHARYQEATTRSTPQTHLEEMVEHDESMIELLKEIEAAYAQSARDNAKALGLEDTNNSMYHRMEEGRAGFDSKEVLPPDTSVTQSDGVGSDSSSALDTTSDSEVSSLIESYGGTESDSDGSTPTPGTPVLGATYVRASGYHVGSFGTYRDQQPPPSRGALSSGPPRNGMSKTTEQQRKEERSVHWAKVPEIRVFNKASLT